MSYSFLVSLISVLNIFCAILSVLSTMQNRNTSAAEFKRIETSAAFNSVFRTADSSVLRELGTEKVRQVLKPTLSIAITRDSYVRVVYMFVFFRFNEMSLPYIIACFYIQLNLGGSVKGLFVTLQHAPHFFTSILSHLWSSWRVASGPKKLT